MGQPRQGGASRLNSIQRSNSVNSTYSYDVASRLTNLSHVNGATTLASFAYSVDARGNRTGVVENQLQTPSGTDTHNIVYTYDNLARVSEAIYRSGGSLGTGTLQRQYDYQYDVAGNRTQQIVNIGGSTTTNYTYNAANQISSDGTHSYTYDNAGRLTSDGVNTYAWDRANRLLSVGSTSYLYNGLGQRVQQTVSATATRGFLKEASKR
jgi:YD repeat-containing protein